MAGDLDILKVVDSHLVLHLLGPGEADVAQGEGESASELAVAHAGDDLLPENLAQDLVDEVADMLDAVADMYAQSTGWERPLVFGFVDGVLAVANDTWASLEDSYYEDANNPVFKTVDAAIDLLAQNFDGERAWDEAAKGNVRAEVARSETDPATIDAAFWTVHSHGFMYGADAAYDLEWKLIITPANNIMITDEDSISDVALARMQAETGQGSLVDRMLGMIGIDSDELAAALGLEDDEDEADETDGEHDEASDENDDS